MTRGLILNNIENKLLKLICAVINSGCAYIKNYKSINPNRLKTARHCHNIQTDKQNEQIMKTIVTQPEADKTEPFDV